MYGRFLYFMQLKEITIDSKKELDPYFDLVDYEACEYCFTTLFMWQHAYKTMYYIGDGFAVLVGEHNGEIFSILPLAPKDKIKDVLDFVVKYFEDQQCRIFLRGIDVDVVNLMKEIYGDEKFDFIAERDIFDYVYDAEMLRTAKGRKMQKKRNHINYFLREYDGRYEYKRLGKEDFNACLKLVDEWHDGKDLDEIEDDDEESMNDELRGIRKIFRHYDILKDKLIIGGVFIDGKLEAFTMGEKITDTMALIHIEKANADIRGLYPFINKEFLAQEFPDVELVNREEDMGIEGLRKAKLSYHPVKFVEKYTVREKDSSKKICKIS